MKSSLDTSSKTFRQLMGNGIEYYSQSNSVLAKNIAQDYSEWDERAISRRQAHMASVAKGIWCIPALQ